MKMLKRENTLTSVLTSAPVNISWVSFPRKYWRSICFITIILFIVLSLIFGVIYNNAVSKGISFKDEMEVVGWERYRSRNASDYVLPNNNTNIISIENICSGENLPFILIIVISAVKNFALRSAIRETWGLSAYEKFKNRVVFLLGISLDEEINERVKYESTIHKDVIVEDFIDTYNNLTVKTLMMLKWVKKYCNHTPYIMKSDDDVYVNMNNLNQLADSLMQPYNQQNIWIGYLMCNFTKVNDINSKWYMPGYIYPHQEYPPFLNGYGYLMSMSMALKLYKESFSIPLLHLEDVFLGLCARQVGIQPAGLCLIEPDSDYIQNIECSSNSGYYSIVLKHHVSSDNMYNIHTKLMPSNKSRLYPYYCNKKK